jgi:ATP-dependent RNA helicase DHX37/DHR1
MSNAEMIDPAETKRRKQEVSVGKPVVDVMAMQQLAQLCRRGGSDGRRGSVFNGSTVADTDLVLLSQRAEQVAAQAAASTEKMSSKKKKRLDAYIQRKLKKEERVHLIASLA